MAIFLIYGKNNTHLDPEKDQRGCYKRGMIVEIFEDDTPLVLPPAEPFYIIKITGITKAQAEKYAQPDTIDEDGQIRVLRRRLYKVDWDILPNAVKNALLTNRYYETTLANIRGYIRNLKTGELES